MFHDELSTSPAEYVESVRFDAAVRLLHAGLPVATTARQSGIGNPETLRQQRFRSAVTLSGAGSS